MDLDSDDDDFIERESDNSERAVCEEMDRLEDQGEWEGCQDDDGEDFGGCADNGDEDMAMDDVPEEQDTCVSDNDDAIESGDDMTEAEWEELRRHAPRTERTSSRAEQAATWHQLRMSIAEAEYIEEEQQLGFHLADPPTLAAIAAIDSEAAAEAAKREETNAELRPAVNVITQPFRHMMVDMPTAGLLDMLGGMKVKEDNEDTSIPSMSTGGSNHDTAAATSSTHATVDWLKERNAELFQDQSTRVAKAQEWMKERHSEYQVKEDEQQQQEEEEQVDDDDDDDDEGSGEDFAS